VQGGTSKMNPLKSLSALPQADLKKLDFGWTLD
jgi:hypothetical protein